MVCLLCFSTFQFNYFFHFFSSSSSINYLFFLTQSLRNIINVLNWSDAFIWHGYIFFYSNVKLISKQLLHRNLVDYCLLINTIYLCPLRFNSTDQC